MIDFVHVHPSQILDTRTLTLANMGTQHRLVLCEYRLKHVRYKKRPPIYITKFNTESLTDLVYEFKMAAEELNLSINCEKF